MKVTKLEKAQQIIAALYNLPALPTEGINFNRAVKLARKSVSVIDPQWRLANKMLLDRQKVLPRPKVECRTCHGSGVLLDYDRPSDSYEKERCLSCNGAGEI